MRYRAAPVVALLIALLALPASAVGARGETLLISRASGLAGVGANDDAASPSISADGRFVAFASDADNLSTGDNNSFTNIFVRDTQTDTTILISRNDVAGANDHSFSPSISADGRFVAFASDADNLSTGDNNSFRNVFVQDVQTPGVPTLISRNAVAGADEDSLDPALSGDGRFVAFRSDADNLSTVDNDSFSDVFVQSVEAPGAPTLVSRNAVTGADDDSSLPSISADGRLVAFESVADNLSAIDANSFRNVFVQNVQAPGAPTLVSRNAVAGADASSFRPSISADGRFVAFASFADNLSAADNDAVENIFIQSVQAPGAPTLASRASSAGAGGSDDSSRPSISASGGFVAFHSDADNLSLADNNGFRNVFRRDVSPPTCSNVSQAVGHDTPTTVNLRCTDGDGDPIIRAIVSGPAHGTLGPVNQVTGTVTYTPDPGFAGPDSFRFQGSDVTGASNTATASLSVSAKALLPRRCANLLRGTNGGETLTGTVAGDRILGLGGNDVLRGLAGDDCLAGGTGRDRLSGGSGRDRLSGNSSRDRLSGGSGDDRLAGNSGNDGLSGGSGRDRLSGGSGRDRLTGGSGRDRLAGGKQRDAFNAGSGNDRINSADGRRERVRCGRGTDRVRADVDDVLIGCERVRRV